MRTSSRTKAAPRRDAAVTRERILDAATTEFAGKGFSGARTDGIAAAAGANIRMLYHYFGSTEALYLACQAVLADETTSAAR